MEQVDDSGEQHASNPYVAAVKIRVKRIQKKLRKIGEIELRKQTGGAINAEQLALLEAKASLQRALGEAEALREAIEEVAREEEKPVPKQVDVPQPLVGVDVAVQADVKRRTRDRYTWTVQTGKNCGIQAVPESEAGKKSAADDSLSRGVEKLLLLLHSSTLASRSPSPSPPANVTILVERLLGRSLPPPPEDPHFEESLKEGVGLALSYIAGSSPNDVAVAAAVEQLRLGVCASPSPPVALEINFFPDEVETETLLEEESAPKVEAPQLPPPGLGSAMPRPEPPYMDPSQLCTPADLSTTAGTSELPRPSAVPSQPSHPLRWTPPPSAPNPHSMTGLVPQSPHHHREVDLESGMGMGLGGNVHAGERPIVAMAPPPKLPPTWDHSCPPPGHQGSWFGNPPYSQGWSGHMMPPHHSATGPQDQMNWSHASYVQTSPPMSLPETPSERIVMAPPAVVSAGVPVADTLAPQEPKIITTPSGDSCDDSAGVATVAPVSSVPGEAVVPVAPLNADDKRRSASSRRRRGEDKAGGADKGGVEVTDDASSDKASKEGGQARASRQGGHSQRRRGGAQPSQAEQSKASGVNTASRGARGGRSRGRGKAGSLSVTSQNTSQKQNPVTN
jgi:hypothetical protein